MYTLYVCIMISNIIISVFRYVALPSVGKPPTGPLKSAIVNVIILWIATAIETEFVNKETVVLARYYPDTCVRCI